MNSLLATVLISTLAGANHAQLQVRGARLLQAAAQCTKDEGYSLQDGVLGCTPVDCASRYGGQSWSFDAAVRHAGARRQGVVPTRNAGADV